MKRNRIRNLPRAAALIAAIAALAGCFLYPGSHSYELIELPALRDASGSGFKADGPDPAVLRSGDSSAMLTGIRECDIVKPAPPLTRTRQLFVGFQAVRVPVASLLDINGVPVQRTAISATLDSVPLTVIDYSFMAEDCAFDIILWSGAQGAPGEEFTRSQSQLEAFLPQVIAGLER